MDINTQHQKNRFSISTDFFKQSLKFISINRDLIWLPVLSFVLVLILLGLFAKTVMMDIAVANNYSIYLAILTILIGYFAISYLVFFMQAWLIACIYERMQNNHGTLRAGFQKTLKHSGVIFTWSILNASIGIFLNILESTHDLVADVVELFLGATWGILTFFVIPFLVIEGTGVRITLSKSISLLGKGWRKLITLWYFQIALIVPFIVITYLFYHFQPEYFTHKNKEILFILGVVIFTSQGLFNALFNAILKSSFYLYYVENKKPTNFPEELLNNAFTKNIG